MTIIFIYIYIEFAPSYVRAALSDTFLTLIDTSQICNFNFAMIYCILGRDIINNQTRNHSRNVSTKRTEYRFERMAIDLSTLL